MMFKQVLCILFLLPGLSACILSPSKIASHQMSNRLAGFRTEGVKGSIEGVTKKQLLFPGSDFEDWIVFQNLNSPNDRATATVMLSHSSKGIGVDGGSALIIKGKPETGYPIVVRIPAPKNFSFKGKTKVVFYIKGSSVNKSPVIQWYKPNAKNFYTFELSGTRTEDRILIAKAGDKDDANGRRAYNGTIDTNGKWVKITLPLTYLPHGAGNSSGTGYLFGIRVPSDGIQDLLIDNITIE